MLNNPWRDLPHTGAFVLEVDEPRLSAFNHKVGSDSSRFLQLKKILPEPFIGRLDAPVVLLSNNPGFSEKSDWRTKPEFMSVMRENLEQRQSDYPFIYLNPEFDDHNRWWKSKLRLLIEVFGTATVARSIVNVPYFP